MSEAAPKATAETPDVRQSAEYWDNRIAALRDNKDLSAGYQDKLIAEDEAEKAKYVTAEAPAAPEAGEAPASPEATGDLQDNADKLKGQLGLPETVKSPEEFKEVLLGALGATVSGTLSPAMVERLRTEPILNATIENMHANGLGVDLENSPKYIAKYTEMFIAAEARGAVNAQGETATGTNPEGSKDDDIVDEVIGEEDDTVENASWWKRTKATTGYYAGRVAMWPHTMMMASSKKYNARYESATPEQRKKMERKAKVIGWLGTAAAITGLGIAAYMRFHGVDHSSGGHTGHEGTPDQNPEDVKPEVPQLTPEQMLSNSHGVETDWLNNNHRVNHDFNNITPDKIGVPGDKDHFPGYTALHEQYQKSPSELSAQLRQIEVIEQAKGGHLEALPAELRLQPGESHDAYITRLSDAIARDDKLHTTLTDATLDYIKDHGQPLKDITQSYSSDYLVIENGKPTVLLDQYVSSADPNDKILILSGNKGIRFPCGQPIELIPQQQNAPVSEVVRQAAPIRHEIAHAAPQPPVDSAPAPQEPIVTTPDQTPEVPATPPATPETPPAVPEKPEVPIDKPTVSKKDPFTTGLGAANPEEAQKVVPRGSGRAETAPAPVVSHATVGGVSESSHVDGGAAATRESGMHAPSAAKQHTGTEAPASNVDKGSTTSGGRVGSH